MAQLDTGGNSKGKSKQKKMNARVDFTPMVDMIMLLVTFFMLCTTLLKPQTMQITMPSDKDDIKKQDKSQVQTDEAITIIIGKDNKLYYFEGNLPKPHFKKQAMEKMVCVQCSYTRTKRQGLKY